MSNWAHGAMAKRHARKVASYEKCLVGRDSSCGFPYSKTSMVNCFMRGTASFVCQFLKRCEPPLMLIYGEFGTVA